MASYISPFLLDQHFLFALIDEHATKKKIETFTRSITINTQFSFETNLSLALGTKRSNQRFIFHRGRRTLSLKMLLPSPNELLLEGPYDKERRIMFTLMNEFGENQAYKIKSTAPETIAVSPSSGFVRAFDRVEVSCSRCQKIFVTDWNRNSFSLYDLKNSTRIINPPKSLLSWNLVKHQDF